MKFLVIGDSCIDIFIYGEIERIAPEAPVPIIRPIDKVENDGMAKNVRNNVRALGDDIEKSIKFAQDCTTKVVQKHGVTTI